MTNFLFILLAEFGIVYSLFFLVFIIRGTNFYVVRTLIDSFVVALPASIGTWAIINLMGAVCP